MTCPEGLSTFGGSIGLLLNGGRIRIPSVDRAGRQVPYPLLVVTTAAGMIVQSAEGCCLAGL
jgi:hypothetical protein